MIRSPALLGALLVGLTGCGGPVLEIAAPLVVAHASPSHGSIGVSTRVLPRVGFNRRPAAATLSGIGLEALDADGAFVARPIERLADDDGHTIQLVPGVPLAPLTRHRIVVAASVTDEDGTPLEAPLRAEFVTGAE